MTKNSAEFHARRRAGIPPLWSMSIIALLLVLYSVALISITATAVTLRLEQSPAASAQSDSTRRPPLTTLDPKVWLYKPGTR